MEKINNNTKDILEFINNKKSSQEEIDESNKLVNIGYQISNIKEKKKIYENAIFLNPHNGNALVQLGLIEINNPNKNNQIIGFYLLEKAFDNNFAEYEKNKKIYTVNLTKKTCTCPDFIYRKRQCKHLTKLINESLNTKLT